MQFNVGMDFIELGKHKNAGSIIPNLTKVFHNVITSVAAKKIKPKNPDSTIILPNLVFITHGTNAKGSLFIHAGHDKESHEAILYVSIDPFRMTKEKLLSPATQQKVYSLFQTELTAWKEIFPDEVKRLNAKDEAELAEYLGTLGL